MSDTVIVTTYWHIGGGWYDVRVNGHCATVRGKHRAEQKAKEMTQQCRRDIDAYAVYESMIMKGQGND